MEIHHSIPGTLMMSKHHSICELLKSSLISLPSLTLLSHFFPEVSLRKLTFFNHSSLISKNILSFLSHINTPVSLLQLSGDRPTHTQFSLRCFSCHLFSHFFRIILTFHSCFSSVTKIPSPVTYIYKLINQSTLLK